MSSVNQYSINSTPSPSNMPYSSMAMVVTTKSGKQVVIDDCLLDYLEILSELLGFDMNYEKFSSMSDSQRESYKNMFKREKKFKDLDI
jgi:hypothetical protein